MSEFLQQIEALKGRDRSGKNIFATSDPGTGDITIHRYIVLVGPKRQKPCIPRLHTMFTFNPESASSTSGIDLSQVLVQVPEDNSLDDSQCGFEALMADLVATHTKQADTWLGAVKREERANALKIEASRPNPDETESVVTAAPSTTTSDDLGSKSGEGAGKDIEDNLDDINISPTKDDKENKSEECSGGEEDEDEEEKEEEEEEWKPPTIAEQCQRMYREINDVYKRRNAAAAEGKWHRWEQFAGAEMIMRVRHIWWMDVSEK